MLDKDERRAAAKILVNWCLADERWRKKFNIRPREGWVLEYCGYGSVDTTGLYSTEPSVEGDHFSIRIGSEVKCYNVDWVFMDLNTVRVCLEKGKHPFAHEEQAACFHLNCMANSKDRLCYYWLKFIYPVLGPIKV